MANYFLNAYLNMSTGTERDNLVWIALLHLSASYHTHSVVGQAKDLQ